MSKYIKATLIVLILGLLVFINIDKSPELPDYKKWELSEWDFQKVLYRGELSYTLGAAYQDGNDNRIVVTYFEPVSEDQYKALESLDVSEIEKRIDLMLDGTPLFVEYFGNNQDGYYIYFYESLKGSFAGQSSIRFVRKFTNTSASESSEDSEKIEVFIEQRYKIKFVHD